MAKDCKVQINELAPDRIQEILHMHFQQVEQQEDISFTVDNIYSNPGPSTSLSLQLDYTQENPYMLAGGPANQDQKPFPSLSQLTYLENIEEDVQDFQ
jgi:hypothetical protein